VGGSAFPGHFSSDHPSRAAVSSAEFGSGGDLEAEVDADLCGLFHDSPTDLHIALGAKPGVRDAHGQGSNRISIGASYGRSETSDAEGGFAVRLRPPAFAAAFKVSDQRFASSDCAVGKAFKREPFE
jgi:hypothetical protein